MKLFNKLVCIGLITLTLLCGCGSKSYYEPASTVGEINYIEGEYVREGELPDRPLYIINAIDRIIFFSDGKCAYCYYAIWNESNKEKDSYETSSCEYSYSRNLNYILVGSTSVMTISKDLEKIYMKDGTVLKKVK